MVAGAYNGGYRDLPASGGISSWIPACAGMTGEGPAGVLQRGCGWLCGRGAYDGRIALNAFDPITDELHSARVNLVVVLRHI
jgi:hypothetical protein